MRIELPYFQIGDSYGGNQSWFRDPMMHLGGCAAATACDVCIYMAAYVNKLHLYPHDIKNLNRKNYVAFSKTMKPYLKPRFRGIDTLKLFIDGFQNYLKTIGEEGIQLEGFSGNSSEQEAAIEIKRQIDYARPIPFLLLRHENNKLKNFTWHWFLIVGYEEINSELYVKFATYGAYHWLPLHELWETGYKEKGGMVLIR
jgi:hypothetical protein